MRVLQNVGLYPSYLKRLYTLFDVTASHRQALAVFLADGFESTHLLQGVLDDDPAFALSLGNSERVQHLWAAEQGLPRKYTLDDILLAQIEHHRAEVFYNLDPVRFDDRLLKRLPGCVRRSIAWSAAPSPHTRFQGYDLIVNNFPGILRHYAERGCRTAYFFPAMTPLMRAAAKVSERPIDILFVGGYSRHHIRRAGILEAVAGLAPAVVVRYHLDLGRLNRLAELPLASLFPPLRQHCRPRAVRAVASPALFGRELYEALGHAKIVLNAAVDMAGNDRGNIRCFEAMGCGSLLLSDAGLYPAGMAPGETLVTYDDAADAVRQALVVLKDESRRQAIADAGHHMLEQRYSKAAQQSAFVSLVS